ncbi:MAG: ornithine cyclodeaminase family protein [Clostridiales bacterium]|jgi:ornithine cyclodeaminase|nr:ornithine cyclodeaminase family protein [Clostridiales bacterium]
MLFVNRDIVEKELLMKNCIDLMRKTLIEYSRREAIQVLRTAMKIGEKKILGVMPSALTSRQVAGAKIITVFPSNYQKGLPSHQGVVVLFETETGSLKAVVDGEAITGIRTAAVSAVATDALAREDAHILCVMGSGLQARRHLEAISLVRKITEVRVWDIDKAAAALYAKKMQAKYGIPVYDCGGDPERAVSGADIICTVTAARQPVLFSRYVSLGAHINAVGACAAADRELDTELVRRARFFGDSIESVTRESGDFIIPLKEGAIGEGHLLGEVGQILSGELPGRAAPEEITVFEALGLAVEDLAAANYIACRVEAKQTKGGEQ